VLLLFWPVIAGKGTFWNDFIQQYFPYRIFASVSLRQGEFPFWNPYLFSGMPFFADIQTAVLYPANLLLVLFASPQWLSPYLFELQIILHVLFAGLAMYVCARGFSLPRSGALIAALVYMLCGFTTAHIFHVTIVHALGWLVLSVWGVRRMLDTRRPHWIAVTSLFLWMVALAGHPQLLVYLYYWLGAYLVYHCIMRWRESKRVGPLAHALALFAAAVSIAIALSSVQLLPTAQLGTHSIRSSISYEKSAECSLRPYRFLTFLAPNLFGRPNDFYDQKRSFYWGMGPNDHAAGVHYYWETAIYIGILPLMLILCAVLLGRSPPVIFLGVMSACALAFAMGDAFFLHWIAYHVLPGFSRFRIPGRFAGMFSISASLLAGFGWMWLRSRGPRMGMQRKKMTLWLCAGGGALILLSILLLYAGAFDTAITGFMLSSGRFGSAAGQLSRIIDRVVRPTAGASLWRLFVVYSAAAACVWAVVFQRLPSRVLAAAVLVVVAVDLLSFGWGYPAKRMKPDQMYPRTALIDKIKTQYDQELFRINARNSKPGSHGLDGSYLLFHKNAGSVYRIFLLEGYTPLRMRRKLNNRREKTLDLLNTKYKIKVNRHTREKAIVNHHGYFPRVWMAYDYTIVQEPDSILPLMYADTFDHGRTIILEETPVFERSQLRYDSTCSARITDYGLNRITMEVSTATDGFVLLSEIHYPAWKAFVDGEPAPLYRADYALRAIPVTAGTHEVVCTYQSAAFARGATITVLGLVVVAGLFVWSVWGRTVKKTRN
jgi:hypothetical protein